MTTRCQNRTLPLHKDYVFNILNDDHNYFLENPQTQYKKLQKDSEFIAYIETEYRKILLQSAIVIQRHFRNYLDRKVYKYVKSKLQNFRKQPPCLLLKRINIYEASLFDRVTPYSFVLKLNGESFPPTIVYKIFLNTQVALVNYGDTKKINPSLKKWQVFYKYFSRPSSSTSIRSSKSYNSYIGHSRKRRRVRQDRTLTWISKKYF